jgi:hypothetical protein
MQTLLTRNTTLDQVTVTTQPNTLLNTAAEVAPKSTVVCCVLPPSVSPLREVSLWRVPFIGKILITLTRSVSVCRSTRLRKRLQAKERGGERSGTLEMSEEEEMK